MDAYEEFGDDMDYRWDDEPRPNDTREFGGDIGWTYPVDEEL